VPLLGLPFEGGVAVIASNFGQRHQPAWLHNLRRDPTAELSIAGGPRRRVRATELEGAARARLWERGLRVYPGWSQYEVRAGDRRIAVFLLEPA
jgi:deazaflavin-dependent oxidoreductase (nitroreductase family)